MWGDYNLKQSTYLIGFFILGLSIVISAFILSNALSNTAGKDDNNSQIINSTPDLMTITQLSEYLQISEQSIESIIHEDNSLKEEFGDIYETYRLIPYLKIDNQIRFIKTEIDQWLKYKNDFNYQ